MLGKLAPYIAAQPQARNPLRIFALVAKKKTALFLRYSRTRRLMKRVKMVLTLPQVDIKNSTCPNIFQICLKSAAKFSQSSPCTNVPLQCPLCPPDSLERIWKYNLHAHLSSHKDANPEFHKELYDLAENELTLMKAVFLTKPRKSKNKSHAPTKLTLSDVHSTRNIMRYILSFTHSLLTLMLIYFCV